MINQSNAVSQYHQPSSHFNKLSKDVQFLVFSYFGANDLAIFTLVCKEWRELADDDRLWKWLAKKEKVELKTFYPSPKIAYIYDRAFCKLKLKDNLSPEIAEKLEKLEIYPEEIDFKNNGTFSDWGAFRISKIKIPNQEKDKDYSFKKMVGKDLVFIFIAKDAFKSIVYKFNPSFNPNRLTEDEYLYLTYECNNSGFFLSKKDKKGKRDVELRSIWSSLMREFRVRLGLDQEKETTMVELFQATIQYHSQFYLLPNTDH